MTLSVYPVVWGTHPPTSSHYPAVVLFVTLAPRSRPGSKTQLAAAWGCTSSFTADMPLTDNVLTECVNLYTYQTWRQRLDQKLNIGYSQAQCRAVRAHGL